MVCVFFFFFFLFISLKANSLVNFLFSYSLLHFLIFLSNLYYFLSSAKFGRFYFSSLLCTVRLFLDLFSWCMCL